MLVANGGAGFRLQGSGKGYMGQVRRKLAAVTYETQVQSGVGMLQRERDNLAEHVHLFSFLPRESLIYRRNWQIPCTGEYL